MILITGGAGYIGTHLVLGLLRDGYSIVVFDNLSNSTINNLRRMADAKVAKGRFAFVKGDVRDRAAVKRVFNRFEITKVIHLAGLKSINESILNAEIYHEVNVEGSRNVFEVALEHDVFTIVFSSTAAAYKQTDSGIYSETNELDGSTSPYSQTKIDAENILHELKKKDITVDMVILRYFNPVGTDSSIPLYEENATLSNLFPTIVQNIIDHTYFPIYGNDYDTKDGTAVRDYIHVSDLVAAHRLMIGGYALYTTVRVFNVGSGTGYTVREVVETFNREYIHPVLFTYFGRRTGDAATSIADTTKIRNSFNWKPIRTLTDMVRSVLSKTDLNKRK